MRGNGEVIADYRRDQNNGMKQWILYTVTGDLRVTIKTPEDFEKAKPLIDRAYNEK
jgi:predicted transport protein